MRVGTYPTRNFATLGPLLLRPPFTGASVAGFPVISSPTSLTFRHWAGVSPYTSACAVAETCVFGKQSLEPAPCGPLGLTARRHSRPTLAGRPFSRSYGANLPSSLTEDHSSTLRVFPLPTSVGVRYGRPGFLAERLF